MITQETQGARESMATIEWKNIPVDILSNLAKLLNSDVDILRLRSVCSPWRSSLPLPHKPFSFPLKLPPFFNPSDYPFYKYIDATEIKLEGEHFVLDEVTMYRLSPLADDDSSNGWLLRAINHPNSNTFTLLDSVTMQKMEDPTPKQLNLLDSRVSEICKYHTVNDDLSDAVMMMMSGYKKAIALWNYFPDCEFAALVLFSNGTLRYWKLGDEDWTLIDALCIDDVILYQGKCYAVHNGVLACFDSEWNWTIVAGLPIFDHLNCVQTYLVEFDSDLYVVWYYGYDAEQVGDEWYQPPSRLSLARFNECNGSLDSVDQNLRDAFFVLSKYASHGFHAKDFAGFKGNRVYVNDDCFDLEEKLGVRVGVPNLEDSSTDIPCPSWLHMDDSLYS